MEGKADSMNVEQDYQNLNTLPTNSERNKQKTCPIEDEKTRDSSHFLSPFSDRVFEFKTRRVDFRRRKSHMFKLVLIVHFDGVLGDFVQKSPMEETYNLLLRKDVASGLKELAKHF